MRSAPFEHRSLIFMFSQLREHGKHHCRRRGELWAATEFSYAIGRENGRALNGLIILEGRIDGDFLRRLPLDSSFLIGHRIGF
jgi:hypothetical protein